jgi:hypothetical protein
MVRFSENKEASKQTKMRTVYEKEFVRHFGIGSLENGNLVSACYFSFIH